MKKYSATLPLLGLTLGVGSALGGAWYASQQINPRPRRTYVDTYTFTPWELHVPYETVDFSTADGLTLRGWWLPRPDVQRVVICCHGHIGSKDDLLGIGTRLWRGGYNVLLFDMRGRGESDTWPNTLAYREVDDALAAVDFARSYLPGAHIGMVGFSMGAAVAILAAARDPAIAAVLADSPFTSAAAVVAPLIRQRVPLAGRLMYALTEALTARAYGYTLSRVCPVEAVGQLAPRPLFLIHGAEDSMIPVSHAHAMFAAAGEPKELWIYAGVEHCGAYFADRVTYVERAQLFFDQHLGTDEQARHAV